MRLSRRLCWALGAVCLGAGIVMPWAVARVNEVEVVPEVEMVRLRPALVRLPGGTFLMGSPEGDEHAEGDERPQRLVEVPAFSLCQTEVTEEQYGAVLGVNPGTCEFGCGDDLPVQSFSWLDTLVYLNKLTALESEALVALGEEGLSVCYEVNGVYVAWVEDCTGYRLPTEAEWEYAGRAGTTTRFSFGDDLALIGDYAWYRANSGGKLHAVGGKKANPWGLYDMHGNVWEWVWDVYDSYKNDKVVNSDGTRRALRGGSFSVSPWDLRSAYRNGNSRTGLYSRGLGFRCARGVGPQR